MTPLGNRKLNPSATPAFSQFELRDVVSHYEIARVQRGQVGAGIDPSWKA
jgi:hypothetical protein